MFGKGDDFMAIIEAIPDSQEAPLSTMEIWHKATWPKPSYGQSKKILKNLALDGYVENIGGKQGPQFYRLMSDAKWPD